MIQELNAIIRINCRKKNPGMDLRGHLSHSYGCEFRVHPVSYKTGNTERHFGGGFFRHFDRRLFLGARSLGRRHLGLC